jgi:bacterioferritin-associated ferredoxin
MIVCSCNIISDHDIRGAVVATDDELLSAAQVYDCLGCTVRCGRCSQSVRQILEEQPPRCTRYGEIVELTGPSGRRRIADDHSAAGI